jgi:2-polyprenyl-3-methyl-5-hydroxy-6-metoxy-1,4-benzoquinol methylase
MQVDLKEKRQVAAEASGGISNEAIYSAIERIIKSLNLGGHVLDFGAGKGRLAAHLASMGRFESVTAVDLLTPPAAESPPVRWIEADLNGPVDIAASRFDVIIAAEVIEHLENPRAVAREWLRLLRPGGTLVMSTPNNESWRSLSALVFKGHYALFGQESYPAHITALLRKDIERIVTEAAFESLRFFYTDRGCVPKARLQWQTLSMGLLVGLRYSDNVIAVARKPVGPEDRTWHRVSGTEKD